MYQVFRNKRVQLKGQTFDNFEKARQALRKYIRKNLKRLSDGNKSAFGCWDSISRNPARYADTGFSIRKVA